MLHIWTWPQWPVCSKNSQAAGAHSLHNYKVAINPTRMGPPQICERWFINHEISRMNTIGIYLPFLTTYKATERYRLGAPSCTRIIEKGSTKIIQHLPSGKHEDLWRHKFHQHLRHKLLGGLEHVFPICVFHILRRIIPTDELWLVVWLPWILFSH